MNYPTIKYVKALPDYRLFLIFDNNEIKIYDFKSHLEKPTFKALNDIKLFQTARIETGGYGVIWNDKLDLSEYELWTNSKAFTSVERLVEEYAL